MDFNVSFAEPRFEGGPSFITEFESRVRQAPERIAVLDRLNQVSYDQLNAYAELLASEIRLAGCSRNATVGIYARRSIRTIGAILATLKAGCTYVPLDPAYPMERLAYICGDASIRLIFADPDLLNVPGNSDSTVIVLEEVEKLQHRVEARSFSGALCTRAPDPADVAYIIYTSGTTGRPKGVRTTHGNLSHFFSGFADAVRVGNDVVVLATTSISFDPHTVEILLPLMLGGRVVLAHEAQTRSPPELAQLVATHGVNLVQGTPSTWQMMLNDDWHPPHPITLLCGGESMSPSLRDALLDRQGLALWNVYGPTETTVWCSAIRLTKGQPITLGPPIAGTIFRVLDDAGREVGAGEDGELYIGGDGVMAGYHGREDLDREKLVSLAVKDGKAQRFFRSGDIVRRLFDGDIKYLSRADFQVKVRGFRVELLEIEAVINRLPEVAQAAVVLVDSERLSAFVVCQDARLSKGEFVERVSSGIARALPSFMVPDDVFVVPALPVTPNRKIDRQTLVEFARKQEDQHTRAYVDSANPTEKSLERIMADVLGRTTVPLDKGFFDLGGHSINVVKLRFKISESFDARLPPSAFSANPSVRDLALLIDGATSRTDMERATGSDSRYPLSPAQVLMLREVDLGAISNYNLEFLVAAWSERKRVLVALERLVAAHDVFAISEIDSYSGTQKFSQSVVPRIVDATPQHSTEAEFLASIPGRRSSICIAEGRFYQFVIFASGGACLVYFVANHLIIDELSLDLLRGKLDALLSRLDRQLPNCASYQQWLCAMLAHCNSPAIRQDAGRWARALDAASSWPEIEHATGQNQGIVSRSVELLVEYCGDTTYRARFAHTVLLTAICASVGQHLGIDSVPCRLVDNGRQAKEELDTGFTVGWLSHHAPAIVQCRADLVAMKQDIDAELDGSRGRSADYGWLAYVLRHPELVARPELSAFPVYFNFLTETTHRWRQLQDRSADLPPMPEARSRMYGFAFVAYEHNEGKGMRVSLFYDQSSVRETIVLAVLKSLAESLAQLAPGWSQVQAA